VPNEICYIELIAADGKKAAAFYSKVFGWQIEPLGEEYISFKPSSGVSGGFSKPMPGLDQGACVYIATDDIDAALEKIIAAGGAKVTGKTKISDEYGFYALFKDASGNVLGLWSQH
jgi:uncharacterized protein